MSKPIINKFLTMLCAAIMIASFVPFNSGNVAKAAASFYDETILFESTVDGYAQYRIPGVVVTGNGTIITYMKQGRLHLTGPTSTFT